MGQLPGSFNQTILLLSVAVFMTSPNGLTKSSSSCINVNYLSNLLEGTQIWHKTKTQHLNLRQILFGSCESSSILFIVFLWLTSGPIHGSFCFPTSPACLARISKFCWFTSTKSCFGTIKESTKSESQLFMKNDDQQRNITGPLRMWGVQQSRTVASQSNISCDKYQPVVLVGNHTVLLQHIKVNGHDEIMCLTCQFQVSKRLCVWHPHGNCTCPDVTVVMLIFQTVFQTTLMWWLLLRTMAPFLQCSLTLESPTIRHQAALKINQSLHQWNLMWTESTRALLGRKLIQTLGQKPEGVR